MAAPTIVDHELSTLTPGNTQNVTVPYPDDAGAGDLLIGATGWRRTGAHTSDSSVFAEVAQASRDPGVNDNTSASVWERAATGSESGSAGWTKVDGLSAHVVGAILQITGHDGIEHSTVTLAGTSSASSVTVPSVTSAGEDRLWLVLIIHNSDDTENHAIDGFTPLFHAVTSGGTSGNRCQMSCQYRTVGEGATGTRSVTFSSNKFGAAISVLIAPDEGGGGQDPPTGLTVTPEGAGLRAEWESEAAEFVLERETWAGVGDPE